MMKNQNVLVLTPIYPADDMPKTDTPVVHYFTREWVRMGYNVVVINYVARFPNILYKAAKPFKEIIGAKVGFQIRTSPYKDKEYELEGVRVKRIVLKKPMPHVLHPKSEVRKAYDKTLAYCKEIGYVPDAIICHFPNPMLEIMSGLKKEFKVKTSYVVHLANEASVYGKHATKYLKDVDILGFRSEYIKKGFFEYFDIKKPCFQCYSGIPASYMELSGEKDLSNITNFIYVGTLIKRKHPQVIVSSLRKVFGDGDFKMTYIGTGRESKAIKSVVNKYDLGEKVHMLGRIERDEVIEKLDESHVFVMVSSQETYGLVYLEAMARGCITIASRNEGFDGIIQNGVNGFLCKAGDEEELATIINKICNMSVSERMLISENARETAKILTDRNAAKIYIDSVLGNNC